MLFFVLLAAVAFALGHWHCAWSRSRTRPVFGWRFRLRIWWRSRQQHERARRRRRLGLSLFGSLGNVKRATPAQDGRAEVAAEGPPVPRSGDGEALAPVLSIKSRQRIEVPRG